MCGDLDGFTDNDDSAVAVVMASLIGCGEYPAVRLTV